MNVEVKQGEVSKVNFQMSGLATGWVVACLRGARHADLEVTLRTR